MSSPIARALRQLHPATVVRQVGKVDRDTPAIATHPLFLRLKGCTVLDGWVDVDTPAGIAVPVLLLKTRDGNRVHLVATTDPEGNQGATLTVEPAEVEP